MTNFTPVSALLGGALIGLAAALLWGATGRIAGISGIVGGLADAARDDIGWRLAFLLGMVAAPLLYAVAAGGLPRVTVTGSSPVLIAGGLLVGIGTRLGGGCTSGHGVCGIARLSPRSLVATATFMTAGGITVFLVRHVFGA